MLKVVTTGDGSPTLYVPELNEHYHSIHGAYTEAIHVFSKNGLQHCIHLDEIKIFELGFGTGLNATVALHFAKFLSKKIYYESIEKYPIPIHLNKTLSYTRFFPVNSNNLFNEEIKIKEAPWNIKTHINPQFSILKIKGDILAFTPKKDFFNLIFFDAFGPRAQQELWLPPILSKMHNALSSNGIFVTYCANGQMRRDLKTLGFKVKSVPGPPGKREITVATK